MEVIMEYKFETLQLHAGQVVDSETNSRAVPIYQTTAYLFNDTEHAANLFGLKEPGNIYTRIMNPTTDVLEKRIAALDGGVGALAVASGSSATLYSIMNVAQAGDEIIAANTLYGGTYNFFSNTIKDFGITTKFFNTDNPEEIKSLVTSKTRAVFIETIGNPNANIADIEEIAKIAHENGLPLIVDNTFAPYITKPIDFGADIVVYSATKYLGGHGTTIAGVIVDAGKFDWTSERFPSFNTPDPGYHGLKYSDLGKPAFILKARVRLLRDTGATLSPFNSFLILQGVETLSLRMERHCENAKKVAEYLNKHPKIAKVNYSGLEDSKYKKIQEKYAPIGPAGIFTFELNGGLEAGKIFIDNVKLLSHLANVADAKSLVVHPASTTHSQMSKEMLEKIGITQGTVRISVGIEHIDDIIRDIEQALDRI
jgi:O-acetylhomoserine (thiol)-lyase